MCVNLDIRPIPLSSGWFRKKVKDFLEKSGLTLDDGLDIMLGVYDEEDNLVGCAGHQDNVIKCVAIDESLRGLNITPRLISPLIDSILNKGFRNVMLFTKPENKQMFASLGFHIVGEAPKAVMMETDPDGIAGYCRTLSSLINDVPRPIGVIIINANPLTKGHLYLINHASSKCGTLVIIPLADNKHNMFSEKDRTEIIRNSTSSFKNIIIAPSSQYTISSAVFPSYFLKSLSEAAETQMMLDLNIFSSHIANALDASIRFVGSEPKDILTLNYNTMMHNILPKKGISIDEIDRLTDTHGQPYSASRVRQAIEEQRLGDALSMVAPAAIPALLAEAAAQALRQELLLAPKPGLVDPLSNGPHSDMSVTMMLKSIEVITPYLRQFADVTYFNPQPSAASLVEIGKDGEQAMLNASHGINTHRGALFSLGIAVAAAARLIAKRVLLNDINLQAEIALIAEALPASKGIVENSNGQNVIKRFSVKGAHRNACEAYPQLFEKWLPAYRRLKDNNDPDATLKLLLLIISSLQDTNVYHRAGVEGAEFARETASSILADFSIEKVKEADEQFSKRNISTGGAADMLALTLFIYSLLNNKP